MEGYLSLILYIMYVDPVPKRQSRIGHNVIVQR